MASRYSVPERLVAFLRPEIKYTQDYTGSILKVTPAFVVDPASDHLLKTAEKWASAPDYNTYDPVHKTYDPVDFQRVELENSYQTNLRVVKIEHRREGGVALKVVNQEGWLFDLREPEFMEAALTGSLVCGMLKSHYVWSRGVNQMRLVRVGSQIHRDRMNGSQGKGAL